MDVILKVSGGAKPKAPITIFADNLGSIALAKSPVFDSRTTHISIQQYFIQEKVEKSEVQCEYLPTSDMLADLLIKVVLHKKVDRFRRDMPIYEA